MEDKSTPPAATSKAKTSRTRSPAYPAIDLPAAIKRAGVIYAHEKRNSVSFVIAAEHWGFKAKSSGALTTVAALKSFGLIKDVESASGRRIQLTETALRILLDERPESVDRLTLVKQAALSPKMHQILWKKYGTELGSEADLRHQLIFDYKFNENAVSDFIKEYKDTIVYAKLTDSDTISQGTEDKDEDFSDLDEEQNMEPAREPLGKTPPLKPPPPRDPKDPITLLSQALVVSIPRNFRVDINVRGDELHREDLNKIKSQFNRWIEGLEEAFEN